MDWKKKEYWIATVLILLTGIYVNILRYSQLSAAAGANLAAIPLRISEWHGEEFYLDESITEVLKADEYISRRYVNPQGDIIWLFISYFRSQKYGAQIHSPKNCLPGSGWKILKREKYAFTFQESTKEKLEVNRLIISNDKSTDLMFYWFKTRSGIITNEFMLKLDLALNSLKRRPTDAAFIRIIIPEMDANPHKPEDIAHQFLADILSIIEEVMPFEKMN